MSKTIRQKISNVLHTTFRFSPKQKQSKVISCCSVKKPDDYEYIPYQQKQTSTTNDYVELSECHSWSSSNKNGYQLESTRIFSDDVSTFSSLSSIPNEQESFSYVDNTTSFECCHCHCHHYINNNILLYQKNNYLNTSEQKLIKNKIYPFIF